MRLVNTLSLLLTALLGSSQAWALPTDRQQPIRVQANSVELDDRRGVAVYRGDVIITQGSLKITGDTITVTQDNSGELDVFTAVGKPAYYEQQPDVGKSTVQAYGRTIQYFASNQRIILLDEARIVQQGNSFEGEKIVYDTQRQIINAGRAEQEQISSPRPRIDMVIQPRQTTEEATPATPEEPSP